MKLSASLLLASVVSASAFVAPSADTSAASSALFMSDPEKGFGNVGTEARPTETGSSSFGTPTGGYQPTRKSQAIPFINSPKMLDGTMAGDVGFDPLGFAKSQMDLQTYREAEIKHARLAMLAAAGWPLSELWDKKIANTLGMTALVDDAGRVPSVLNGGMGKVSPFYWGFCLVLAAGIDLYGLNMASKKKGYQPGDLGFDPFGLFPKEAKGQKWMRTAEIKNGRLAMVAITAFAFQEFAAHTAVVDQVPFLFKPIWETLSASQPSYYIPEESTPAILDAVTPDVAASTDSMASTVAPLVDAAPAVPEVVAPPAVTEAAPAAVAPPVASSVDTSQELAAAKQRIAELEDKLATIQNLSR